VSPSWKMLAAITITVVAALWAFGRSTGPRCVPGRPQWARQGACMQFCQADGRSVYPLCMIPHPLQHPDAERLSAPPEPERTP